MVCSLGLGSTLLGPQKACISRTFIRHKSLTAAIERGRQGRPESSSRPRFSKDAKEPGHPKPLNRRERRFEQFGPPRDALSALDAESQSHDAKPVRKRNREERQSDGQPRSNRRAYLDARYARWIATKEARAGEEPSKASFAANVNSERDRIFERRERRVEERRSPPFSRSPARFPIRTTPRTETRSSVRQIESLPYTTAASEFLYGYSSVVAALKANRRKLYTLYVHSRGASRDGLLARIRAQKLFSITKEVGDEYMRAMDKASNGRPHNGVILESSPLPVSPITELKEPSIKDASLMITLDNQSFEEASINGKQEVYSYKAAGWRHPLVLYVDGVLDEGNLGAIARSAYFLGVDAIITPSRQTAPWSHIAVKASAGAAEAIPLFRVAEPTDFLGKSSRLGWRIYASDAIPAAATPNSGSSAAEDFSKVIYTFARTTKRLPADHSPVADHPTILMMGAEGTGLRKGLLNMAHYNVGIVHGRDVDEIGVDSLNVSVAASILCYEMLQRRKKQVAAPPEETLF